VIGILALTVGGYVAWTHRSPVSAVPIFQGVRYECIRLLPTPAGNGLAHIVEIDLKAPGIELYVSPMETEALIKGWQFTTVWPWRAASTQNLAVVVNGATFGDDDGFLPWPGDLARSSETVVSRGQVSHGDPNSYLMWFDRDLTPHIETTKPPSPDALAKAYWGMAGQEVVLYNGIVGTHGDIVDARTMIACNPATKTLWLAVFENASYQLAASTLADRGATQGTMLDGGTSSTMTLGAGVQNVRRGTLLNGYRPVATVFGIRAKPLD